VSEMPRRYWKSYQIAGDMTEYAGSVCCVCGDPATWIRIRMEKLPGYSNHGCTGIYPICNDHVNMIPSRMMRMLGETH
jgi:hypothetical protein